MEIFSFKSKGIDKEVLRAVRLDQSKSMHLASFMHVMSYLLCALVTGVFLAHGAELYYSASILLFLTIIRSILILNFRMNSPSFDLVYRLILLTTIALAIFWITGFYLVLHRFGLSVESLVVFSCIVTMATTSIHFLKKDSLLCFLFTSTLTLPSSIFLVLFMSSQIKYFALPIILAYNLFILITSRTAGNDFWELQAKLKELSIQYQRNQEIEKQVFQTSKLASIGTLASGIAHELNNPLTAIIGFAELIRRNSTDGNYVTDKVFKIVTASERMKKTIDQLRVYSRESHDYDWTLFSINDLIRSTLMLLERSYALDEIQLVIRYSENNLVVRGNRNKLESVLHNLLQNARDALMEKERGSEKILTVAVSSKDGIAEIMVNDNGPGIPELIRSQIFDPFFTTKPVGKGTGLGLSITREIVAEHQGTIALNTEVDVGTTFFIRLPLPS